MERIWVVNQKLHESGEGLPANRLAEFTVVRDFEQMSTMLPAGERPMILASVEILQKAR